MQNDNRSIDKAAKIHLMRMRGISTDRPQRPEPEVEIDLEFARHMLLSGWKCRRSRGPIPRARGDEDELIIPAINEWKVKQAEGNSPREPIIKPIPSQSTLDSADNA